MIIKVITATTDNLEELKVFTKELMSNINTEDIVISTNVEKPKTEKSKAEEPKAEEPKKEEPKAEEPKAEEPKKEEPKAEEPKTEKPKTEDPKTEDPKTEEYITLEEFRFSIKDLLGKDKTKRGKVKALITEDGYENLSEIPEGKRKDFLEKVRELLNE